MTEIIREIAGPADLRALHRGNPSRYPFLLQSTSRSGTLGRYDILFASPRDALVAGDDVCFLDELDARWLNERVDATDSELPFQGGWFLYLGYELAGEIEPALELSPDPLLPRAYAVRCTAALVFDHETNLCHMVRETSHDIDREALRAEVDELRLFHEQHANKATSVHEEEAGIFTSAVARAREYIAAGDVYQANLSRSPMTGPVWPVKRHRPQSTPAHALPQS